MLQDSEQEAEAKRLYAEYLLEQGYDATTSNYVISNSSLRLVVDNQKGLNLD